MTISTIEDIDKLTKSFAGARAELSERLRVLREEQEAAQRRRMQGIKNALDRVQSSYAELKTAVGDSPELFVKPKTRVLNGIKVGFQKQKGKLEIPDDSACVRALKKIYGDDSAAYIKVDEKPIKKALENLSAKELKALGISVTDDVDAVLIKGADGDLDKLIAALIGDEDLESLA